MKVGFVNFVNPESEPTVLEFEEAEQDETTYADVLEVQEIEFDEEKHELYYLAVDDGDLTAAALKTRAVDEEILVLMPKLPEDLFEKKETTADDEENKE